MNLVVNEHRSYTITCTVSTQMGDSSRLMDASRRVGEWNLHEQTYYYVDTAPVYYDILLLDCLD